MQPSEGPQSVQLAWYKNQSKLQNCDFFFRGVRSAYVTTLGRLIGVVGLKELRKAIEDSNSGEKSVRIQGDEEIFAQISVKH